MKLVESLRSVALAKDVLGWMLDGIRILFAVEHKLISRTKRILRSAHTHSHKSSDTISHSQLKFINAIIRVERISKEYHQQCSLLVSSFFR